MALANDVFKLETDVFGVFLTGLVVIFTDKRAKIVISGSCFQVKTELTRLLDYYGSNLNDSGIQD